MRKLLLLGCAILALPLLGGCAIDPTTGQPTITPPISSGTDQSVAQKIQGGVSSLCGFVPSLLSVTDILATFAGGGSIAAIADTVINGICTAVKPKGVRRGGRLPVYRGVVIRPA